MRVLWISHSGDLGGAELGLAEGVEALAHLGHSSHVILPKEGPLLSRLRLAETVHICHHNPWVSHQRGLMLTAKWLAYDLRVAAPKIRRLARELRTDVIVSNTITVVVGSLAAGRSTPHLWFLHEFGTDVHGLHFLLGRRLTYFLMKSSRSAIAVHSNALLTHFQRRLEPDRFCMVDYAVPVNDFADTGPLETGGALSIVLVGRLSPGKGQHEAIAAVHRLVSSGLDARLYLVGSGDPAYEAELVRLVQKYELGANVKFEGFRTDPLHVMAAADVVLVCARCEAFGRVTVEAMKLGKAVIGADSGATSELIRNGWNGLLYPPGNVQALADHLAELHRNRRRREAIGSRAKTWAVETFTLEKYGSSLEGALARATAGLPG